jgi:lysophospholipase L1-like esterase
VARVAPGAWHDRFMTTGDVIVFIGDSITDSDRRTDRLGLGYGYVNLVAQALRTSGDLSTVINSGIAGNRVAQLQQRWQADVLHHRPTVVSIYIGVNDTLAAFFEGRPTPIDVFESRYVDLLDRTTAAGATRLVLLEPFFVETEIPSVRWGEGAAFIHEDLAAKQAVVRDLASRHGAAFVPLQAIVDEAAARRGPTMIAADGVHPTPLGHQLIADAWLRAFAEVA